MYIVKHPVADWQKDVIPRLCRQELWISRPSSQLLLLRDRTVQLSCQLPADMSNMSTYNVDWTEQPQAEARTISTSVLIRITCLN